MARAASSEERRLFTVDDLLSLEAIQAPILGGVAISPDGERLAYVRCLPKTAHLRTAGMCGSAATTVWVAGIDGRAAVKLEVGNAASAHQPMWSPDGQYLAVLGVDVTLRLGVTREERSLWIWERASGLVRKVVDQVAGWGELVDDPPMVWIDNRTLLAVARTGKRPRESWPDEIEPREWFKAAEGAEPTSRILDSGGPAPAEPPRVHAVLVDVAGAVLAVDRTTARALGRFVRAPTGKYVALLKPVRGPSIGSQADLVDRQMGDGTAFAARHQLCVVRVAGARCLWAPGGLFVRPRSVRWLPSADALVFAATESGDAPPTVFRAKIDGERLQVERLAALEPKEIVIGGRGQIVVRASAPTTSRHEAREDWWLLSADGPVNLSEGRSVVPETVMPGPDGHTFIGVGEGDLWRLNIGNKKWKVLDRPSGARVTTLAWPFRSARFNGELEPRVAVVAAEGPTYYSLELDSGRVERIQTPSANAQLAGYHPTSNVRVFLDVGRNGTTLSVTHGEQSHTLVALNGFLKDIVEAEVRQIDYRSTDGQALTGWLILPARYEPGRRYPLVTWVYQGRIARRGLTRLFETYALNLQLFAANGYAVLIPSMPDGRGPTQDPYLELPKGVLPAVDKVIDLGVADPARLAVVGLSHGGFSVYGLITQTNRFRAAISMAGTSNYISAYGTLPGFERYRENANEQLFMTQVSENLFGAPLWRDVWRYMRNSPLLYADRVQTPTLIVQGDFDPVPMTQGEEFFTALYRQGKRARFIRYLGEGHTIHSPANIRDLWKQMIQWLMECLGDDVVDERTAQK